MLQPKLTRFRALLVEPELKAEFEEQKKSGPLSGMHNALQAAAGGSAPAGAGGSSGFDLASWMAGMPKNSQGGASGNDAREGGARRR